MSTVSMERLETDTQNFKENIDPLIGGTDIIIFAFGADINNGGEYTGNEKFEYLKSQGYDYYCNVDSNKYFVQMTDEYFRMGRRNVDGYRMYYNPDMLADLFDVSQVFDPSRPTPVPPMNGADKTSCKEIMHSHDFALRFSGLCELCSHKTPRGTLPVNSNAAEIK